MKWNGDGMTTVFVIAIFFLKRLLGAERMEGDETIVTNNRW